MTSQFPFRFPQSSAANDANQRGNRSPQMKLFLCRLLLGLSLAQLTTPVLAQAGPDPVNTPANASTNAPTNAATKSVAVPAAPKTLVLAPGSASQYVLEFNRSPIVSNRLRLESIYDETRLWFTRPRHWKTDTVKVQLRYRHSPALYASRSNLTVLINGTSIGSVPLNQPEGRVGSAIFDVPVRLLRDYNELAIAALQNNSPTCTQDPYDPSLWSEILPDSKIVFNVQPQPVSLNFDRYPYPVFDTLSLEPNQIAYLQPKALDETWLTTAARFQASLGQIAQYRALDSRLVDAPDQVNDAERLVIIGTPDEQPILSELELPVALENRKLLDGNQKALGDDVGVLLMATVNQGKTPVLVATGNTAQAVEKAVQFMVQAPDRQLGTGSVIFVNEVTAVSPPPLREWRGYLPPTDRFKLSDLKTFEDKPYTDVSVRGSHAPALEFDFRALPDDRILPGSSMTLRYSYGPQVNPLTSQVEVQLDGVPLGGARLTSVSGANRQSLRVDIPAESIKPNSKMQINFRLDPRERRSCSRVTDQQLWGKIHADTSFDLKREQVAKLPDLKLLQAGYPFTAPQDLSSTAIVVPDNPNKADLLLMLEVSERLGRLSRYDTVQFSVYRAGQLPEEQRQSKHLIGIGVQAKFPFPEAYQADNLALQNLFSRQWRDSQVQTLPDVEGVIKAIFSPWNSDRMLLALTSQTDTGLDQVRDLISRDPLFYQIEGDTVLVSANTDNPSPFDAQDYTLEFLRQSPQRAVTNAGVSEQVTSLLRNHWFILAPGLIVAALILYSITQFYLKKFTGQEQ
ncbi:cellulose biosynthesis cyclic di-GMP-binding regulatory protein BcsB [Leptolyngbya sp. NK1-12]|uniref:Cellulose biosynthesis cyclic di-GMP-binding regulatory protein BcsB n=1 Tax=Leptolyngbya sp. NK1-12 TaxID=2547451 RepID=A0AA96WAI7_9CYAN|nr:cellulose biosynthesis cyclic di-GMP-binding regulatory protein BcsB [Leptolyngbya sp. NK1-12]WNZ21463.1 cellulose biosynthesis cyclic di-GMP-binding regulatory protein BcsB [Leptolyngbya sp. NK1-12]